MMTQFARVNELENSLKFKKIILIKATRSSEEQLRLTNPIQQNE